MTSSGLRLRQAVLAANDLDAVAGRLAEELDLGKPYEDPGVGAFGLRNAVFALGDTFLEVVSPVRDGTAAGRWIERRGGDCGYMLMFQLDDLEGARRRATELGVRQVLALDLDDIGESHLHPADMRGAIVSVSRPEPAEDWRWGGAGWRERSADGSVVGAEVAIEDLDTAAERWRGVLGAEPSEAGVSLRGDPADSGLVAVRVTGKRGREAVEIGGVRFEFV